MRQLSLILALAVALSGVVADGALTQAQAAKVDAALPARLTKAVDKVR